MCEALRDEFEALYHRAYGVSAEKLRECRWAEKGYRDPFAAATWFGFVMARTSLEVTLQPSEFFPDGTDDYGYDLSAEAFRADPLREALANAGITVKEKQ